MARLPAAELELFQNLPLRDQNDSRALHSQPSIDLDPHPRHTRVLRQHHKRIHTVLQVRLVLEHRRVLDLLDAFRRVLVALPSHRTLIAVSADEG
jgi:hypothetical protein